MSLGIAYELAQSHPVALVRLHGVLDAFSASDLRAVLLDALAGQPVALVLDVSELALADEVALTTVAAVARQAARWPGARILVAGASADMSAAIRRIGVAAHVAVFSSVPAALTAARVPLVPPTVHQHIGADRHAPARARDILARFCRDWGVVREVAVAELIASELVTNAVIHAKTSIDFTVRLLAPHLHIAVRDRSPGQVQIVSELDELAEHGRGLLLVDALATSWGTFVLTDGKVVWATVFVRANARRGRSTVGAEAKSGRID